MTSRSSTEPPSVPAASDLGTSQPASGTITPVGPEGTGLLNSQHVVPAVTVEVSGTHDGCHGVPAGASANPRSKAAAPVAAIQPQRSTAVTCQDVGFPVAVHVASSDDGGESVPA